MKTNQGLSLTELLISLSLSLLLMSALLQQYFVTKKHYQHNEERAKEALDLHLVIGMLRESIRFAGFTPCLGLDHLTTKAAQNLRSLSHTSSPFPELKLSRMDEHYETSLGQLSPSQLLLKNNPHFEKTLLIADCYHAELQQAANGQVSSQGWVLTLKHPLSFHYTPPIYVGEWLQERYFIANNRQKKPSLFYANPLPEMLTDAITDFKVEVLSHNPSVLRLRLNGKNTGPYVLDTRVRIP